MWHARSTSCAYELGLPSRRRRRQTRPSWRDDLPLAERLESLEGLAARIDGLNDAVAAAASPGSSSDPAQQELLGRLEARVEELATSLEERLTASSTGGSTVSLEGEGLMDELERNRMTIERLGLHLGEHDRALAELMRVAEPAEALDELAARVEELAAGGALLASGARLRRGH